MTLCECGCGRVVREGNRFIHGHYNRGKHFSKETREKMSKAMKGRVISVEQRKKQSERMMGKNNPMFGKPRSEGTKKKLRLAAIRQWERMTPEEISELGRKLSKKLKGKVCWCKGLTKETDIRVKKMAEKVKGRHCSVETRKKLSEASKGRHYSVETKKKVSEGLKEYYQKHPERKEVLRESTKALWQNLEYRSKHCGENNGSWKDGSSVVLYPCEFSNFLKSQIKERDNYTCQICGCTDRNELRVHHIDYNKKNNHPSNLVTLCCRCNPKVNGNRSYWEAFFSVLLQERMDVIIPIDVQLAVIC